MYIPKAVKAFDIAANIISCDISYRGGTLKVDVSSLFPSVENAVMGAYQNYLGGGIAGAIVGAAMFEPSELTEAEQKVFFALKERIKQYFFAINNGGGDEYMQSLGRGYAANQRLAKSGY